MTKNSTSEQVRSGLAAEHDEAYSRFYRFACDVLASASRKARAKGKHLPLADQIAAMALAHLRVVAVMLAERPEIDPAIFDGEMTRHVALIREQIAELESFKRKQGIS
jgi:hypothetical protein